MGHSRLRSPLPGDFAKAYPLSVGGIEVNLRLVATALTRCACCHRIRLRGWRSRADGQGFARQNCVLSQRRRDALLVLVCGFGWFDYWRQISEKSERDTQEHEGHSDESRGMIYGKHSAHRSDRDSRTPDCGSDPRDPRFFERGYENPKGADRKHSAENGVDKIDELTSHGNPSGGSAVRHKQQRSNSNYEFDTGCA